MESLDEGGHAPYAADGALVEEMLSTSRQHVQEGCSAAAGDSLCAVTTEAGACSVSPTGGLPREVPPRHRVSFTFSPFRPKHGSPAVRTLATPSSPMHLVEVADGSLENAPEVPASAHSCGNELVHPTPADDGERIQPATTARRLEQRLPLQAQRPNFSSAGWAPLGEVFVHGSGECDQLGLGEHVLERRKPALLAPLSGLSIHSIACGSMHSLCLSTDGKVYSWGCGDDGALGRCGADGKPCPTEFPGHVRAVSCGDCHSCALDVEGRVWECGTYKDSSGYIGRVGTGGVVNKCYVPSLVDLRDVLHLVCGAAHTAVVDKNGQMYTWGSNAVGQLGLPSKAGCQVQELVVPMSSVLSLDFAPGDEGLWASRKSDPELYFVARVRRGNSHEQSAKGMTLAQLEEKFREGATSLILTLPDREVPLEEKRLLLRPQRVPMCRAHASNVFASCNCTFSVSRGGGIRGCGLNADGQVGLGYQSLCVPSFRRVQGLDGAAWIGGGLHMSVALVGQSVFTWGRAEYCGHGATTAHVLLPRKVALPSVRTVRCGDHHTLACAEVGTLFTWGCGLTHQLANRPRDWQHPHDAHEDPADEFEPYNVSSKQLAGRFVLVADGGAQHSVELAWTGTHSKVAAPAHVGNCFGDSLALRVWRPPSPPKLKTKEKAPIVAKKPAAASVLKKPALKRPAAVGPALNEPLLKRPAATPKFDKTMKRPAMMMRPAQRSSLP